MHLARECEGRPRVETESPLYQNIPIYLSRYGLRIWEREGKGIRQD